jgi:hypothetical protein
VAQSLQIFNPPSTFTNKLDTTSHLHHKTLPASTLFYKQRTHPHNGTSDTHFRCKSLGNLPEECQDIPLFPMLFNTPNPKEIKEQYKKAYRHFIDINLEKDQGCIVLAQFNENWRHNAAWSTPGGCEIHHNLSTIPDPLLVIQYHTNITLIPMSFVRQKAH